jgi:hypothetical protein
MEIEVHCLKRYEVVTGVTVKITVFWHVTPVSLAGIYCSSKHGFRQYVLLKHQTIQHNFSEHSNFVCLLTSFSGACYCTYHEAR